MAQPEVVAVVDTNVMLDVYSIHDLTRDYDRYSDVDAPELAYRRARGRESLLAAIYLHKLKAATFGMHSELLEQLTKRAPTDATPGTYVETDFTTAFLWFVKDYMLPDWQPMFPREPDEERSNAADQALVDKAKELRVPLITNEGFSKDGYGEGEIGERARKAGVTWYHPRRFYEGKIDEAAEIAAFLERWRVEMPRFLAEHWKSHGKDRSDKFLDLVLGGYRHVLLGETEGRDMPVRISL